MIRRILLCALLLPLAALAQLQLYTVDASGIETPIGNSLNLGNAAVGDTSITTIRIRNGSNAGLAVQAIAISGADFSLPGTFVFALPLRLPPGIPSVPMAPGTFFDFKVGFSPEFAGNFSGVLQVNSSVTVALAANGVNAPTILSGQTPLHMGDTIDFGRLQLGSAAAKPFTISNGNTAAVTVNAISVSGPGFGGPVGVTAPLQLAPQQSVTFQVTFTPQTANAVQGILTVDQRSFVLTGSGFALNLPAASIAIDSQPNLSAQQRSVSIELVSPSPIAANGQLQMTFQPSAPGATDDAAIQFLSGNPRRVQVNINPGDTQAHFSGSQTAWTFQTGTTAGTITFTLTLPTGPPVPPKTLIIAPQQIQLTTVTAVRQTGQLVVSFIGFDNTHAASQLAFTFYDAKGKTVAPGTINVDATNAFSAYFSNNTAGGAFALRAAFLVTGDVTQVSGVQAQLTNPAGMTQTQRLSF